MRIVDFEVIRLHGHELSQPVRPAWAPGSVWTRRDATLVKLTTDEGIVGWGSPGYSASPLLEAWVKPRLLGSDPFLLEQHARTFRNADSCWGVEIALWDIIGKATGQPLYRLWGGHKDRVPGYASCIELRSGAERADDATARLAEGWRAMKLRLHDWTMREDIAQVEGVRKAMGDEFVVLVDANQAQQPGTPQLQEGPAWTYERALQTARELQRLGVFWLEEPLDRYDFDGLRRLCQSVEILIAGGENNRGLHELRWLIEQDVYDVIQPEAMVAETMSGLRKIAGLGEMHRKLVAPHHGGGGVGVAAHLHLACAIPNSSYFEMLHEPPSMSSDVFQWYIREPLRVNAEGDIVAPSGPGLGVEPDEELIARYRV
ncbi:MAG TPA: mandelate racemase/muconate lactonizing enzyme family protein [Chloroflexota bacterium]|nr:mandelate racemase/muconate lactonizing enzyme family protein [Chloroflexota bacterium]